MRNANSVWAIQTIEKRNYVINARTKKDAINKLKSSDLGPRIPNVVMVSNELDIV